MILEIDEESVNIAIQVLKDEIAGREENDYSDKLKKALKDIADSYNKGDK